MAYLDDHPPVRDQWWEKRNRALTGCTVLHTAESVMDTVGPDTGAEAVAEFIRTRTTPGSYHDLCDSDTALALVDYSHGAYHDGTGSNNWALSISWACRTSDWRAMTPERRRAFLRMGARAFIRQQAYRRSVGAPATELRRITKAQSDAGMSGFIAHGDRDPGRRTDPGIAPPNLFPWDEWFDVLREELGGGTPPPAVLEEDDMFLMRNAKGTVVVVGPGFSEWVPTSADHRQLLAKYPQFQFGDDMFGRIHAAGRAQLGAYQQLQALVKDMADEEPAKVAAAAGRLQVASVRDDLIREALELPETPDSEATTRELAPYTLDAV